MNSTSKEQIEKNVKTGKTATRKNSDLAPKAKCSVTAVDGKSPEIDVTSRKKYNLRSSFTSSKVPVRLKPKTGGDQLKKTNETSKSKTIDRFNSKEVCTPRKDKTNVHLCRKISGNAKKSPETHSNIRKFNFHSAIGNAKVDKKCPTKVSALPKPTNSFLRGISMNNLKSDIDDISGEKGKTGFRNLRYGGTSLMRKNLLLRKAFSSGNLVRNESVNLKEMKEELRKGAQISIPTHIEGKMKTKEMSFKDTPVCKDATVLKLEKRTSKISEDETVSEKIVSSSENVSSNVASTKTFIQQKEMQESMLSSKEDIVKLPLTCEGNDILTDHKKNKILLKERNTKFETPQCQTGKVAPKVQEAETSSKPDNVKCSIKPTIKKDLSQKEDNNNSPIFNDRKLLMDTESDKNSGIKRSKMVSFKRENFKIPTRNEGNAISHENLDSRFSPKQEISGIFATTKNPNELLNCKNTLNKTEEELQKLSVNMKDAYDEDCSKEEKNKLMDDFRNKSANENSNITDKLSCIKTGTSNESNSCQAVNRRKSIVEEVDEKLNYLKAKFLQQLEKDKKQCPNASPIRRIAVRKSRSLEPSSRSTNFLNARVDSKLIKEGNAYHTDKSSELENILKKELFSCAKSKEVTEESLTPNITNSPLRNTLSKDITPPFRSSKIPRSSQRLDGSLSPLSPVKITLKTLRKPTDHSTPMTDEIMPGCSYTETENLGKTNELSDNEDFSEDEVLKAKREIASRTDEHKMEESKIKRIHVQKSYKEKSSVKEHSQKNYLSSPCGGKKVIAFLSLNTDTDENVSAQKLEKYEILEIDKCEECKTIRSLPPELFMKWQALKEFCSSEINQNEFDSGEGLKDTKVEDDNKIQTTPLLQETRGSGRIWRSIMALPFKEFTASFCMFIFICIVCFQIEDMNPMLYT